MNRDEKTAVVDRIAEELGAADAIFVVDYRGISVAQAAELRTRLRAADARFRVVKNSLSERAADKAGVESIKPLLVGPTALTFVAGDPAAAAKTLNDAAREMQLLEFKGGLLGGEALSADDVRSIARLPSRDILYGQLVATVAAPLTGLARGLGALVGGLALQLGAIRDMDPPVLTVVDAPAAAEATPTAEVPTEPSVPTEAPAEPAEVPTEAPAEPAEVPTEAPSEPAEAPADVPAEPEAPDVPAEPAQPAEVPSEPAATTSTDETPAASDAPTSDD